MLFFLQQLITSIISHFQIIDMKTFFCLYYCVFVLALLTFSLGTAQMLDDDFDAITVEGNAEDNEDALLSSIAAAAAEAEVPNPIGDPIIVTAEGQDEDGSDDTTTTTSSRRTSKTSTSSTKTSTSTSSKSTPTSSKTSRTSTSTTDGNEENELGSLDEESASSSSHRGVSGATSSSSSGSSMTTAAKVGAGVGGSVGGSAIIFVFAFVFISRHRRKNQKAPDNIVLEAEAPPSEAGDLELGGTNEEPSPSEDSPAERMSIERPAAFDRQTLNPQINHMELPPHYDDLPENRVTAVIDVKEKD